MYYMLVINYTPEQIEDILKHHIADTHGISYEELNVAIFRTAGNVSFTILNEMSTVSPNETTIPIDNGGVLIDPFEIENPTTDSEDIVINDDTDEVIIEEPVEEVPRYLLVIGDNEVPNPPLTTASDRHDIECLINWAMEYKQMIKIRYSKRHSNRTERSARIITPLSREDVYVRAMLHATIRENQTAVEYTTPDDNFRSFIIHLIDTAEVVNQ